MPIIDSYYDIDSKRNVVFLFGYRFYFKTKFQRIQERSRRYLRKQRKLKEYADQRLDIRNLKPATGRLRKKQLECLAILKKIIAVCKGNNLTYWVDFGTLLGAVRHNGFIPWDTDIDITMPRDDFEQVDELLKLCFLNSKYHVRTAGFSNHFQIRVCNNDNSIGLDIFPVDECKTSLTKDEVNIQVKESRKTLIELYPKRIGHVEYDMSSIREDIHRITKENFSENSGKDFIFYGIDYGHSHSELVFDKNIIFPLKQIKFEGLDLPCPNDSVSLLTQLYGDFMLFPENYDILKNVVKKNSLRN